MNAQFYPPPAPAARAARGQGEAIGRGRIFAVLIRNGHAAGELMGYTQRQLRLYYREAIQAENEAQAARIVAVNLGFAGGSAAKEALAKLSGRRGITRRGGR